MAEVSFDTLEALSRTPVGSETAASVVSGFRRWVEVNGPHKVEYNYYQCDDVDDFANEDTFVSGIVHPIAVEVSSVNVDLAGTAFAGSASLEGVESAATFKTVTVRDADGVNGAGILVKVYGN
jgi:hypothetical protein